MNTAAMSLAEVMEMRQQDILGRLGEQAAAEYLERAGSRIRDRNYGCAAGEIGIVAADRRVLVRCRAKIRSGARYGDATRGLTGEKLRMLRLAVRWVLAHGRAFGGLGVDVAGVFRSWSRDFMVGQMGGVG
jgi:putative endonuclease